jgi:hypothetical protein
MKITAETHSAGCLGGSSDSGFHRQSFDNLVTEPRIPSHAGRVQHCKNKRTQISGARVGPDCEMR